MDNSTYTENKELEKLKFAVEGILIPLLVSLGLVGNILSMKVLRSPEIEMKVDGKLRYSIILTVLPFYHLNH